MDIRKTESGPVWALCTRHAKDKHVSLSLKMFPCLCVIPVWNFARELIFQNTYCCFLIICRLVDSWSGRDTGRWYSPSLSPRECVCHFWHLFIYTTFKIMIEPPFSFSNQFLCFPVLTVRFFSPFCPCLCSCTIGPSTVIFSLDREND